MRAVRHADLIARGRSRARRGAASRRAHGEGSMAIRWSSPDARTGRIWLAQTPQSSTACCSMHTTATPDATDDSALVEAMATPCVYAGDYANLK
jgi:hypothetical protein